MRPLECVSLLCLVAAYSALTLRAGAPRLQRVAFAATAVAMGLQALVEGARWQLAPAYALAALGGALALRGGAGPRAGGKLRDAARPTPGPSPDDAAGGQS